MKKLVGKILVLVSAINCICSIALGGEQSFSGTIQTTVDIDQYEKVEVEITDEALNYIIEHNCNNEDGVRNLKRCLEIIHTKLNLYRLMKPDTNLFEQDMSLKVTFPFKITKNCVDKLIKQKDENIFLKHLYV